MSIRASLISFVIRHTIRKQFNDLGDVPALRERLAKSGSMGGKIPDKVTIVPQPIGDVEAEWITLENIDQNRVILYLHGGGYIVGNAEG